MQELRTALTANEDNRSSMQAQARTLHDRLQEMQAKLTELRQQESSTKSAAAARLRETEGELAQRINAEAPGMLGGLLRDRGVPVVHYSTDFVFSGESEGTFVAYLRAFRADRPQFSGLHAACHPGRPRRRRTDGPLR